MNFIVVAIAAGILAFFVSGACWYAWSADANVAMFWAIVSAIGVGVFVAYKVKGYQESIVSTGTNYKRIYNYDMETVFKKMQLRMELAIQGQKFWTPKLIEMSDGWIIYTYTNKRSVLNTPVDTLSLMVARAKDVSESLDEPKTEVIMHFWCNIQLLAPGELLKQAAWLVSGFDATLPKHTKLAVSQEDMLRVSEMLPSPAP